MKRLLFSSAAFSAASLVALLTARAHPPLVPDALIQACVKRTRGAPCSVTLGRQTKQGACTELPDHSLACMPARGGNQGSTNKPPKRP